MVYTMSILSHYYKHLNDKKSCENMIMVEEKLFE